MPKLLIRLLRDEDVRAAARVWWRSKTAAFPWLEFEQETGFDANHVFFRDEICSRCAVWVAEIDQRIVGLLALDKGHIDQLFVDPDRLRTGIGTALLEHARACWPTGLSLFTYQRNTMARRFYLKHGFEPMYVGMSPPPASTPDVKYVWRPARTRSDAT